MKLISLLILSICLHGCSSLSTLKESNTSVQFITGREYESKALELLNSAIQRINIVQYNFATNSGFLEKLIEIKKLHPNDTLFKIQVYLQKPGKGPTQKNAETMAKLEKAGIQYFEITGESDSIGNIGINHTKLLMVDGHKILAGSTNWTLTSLKKNNETNLFIDSSFLGTQLNEYLETLKNKSSFLISKKIREKNVSLLTDRSYLEALKIFLNSIQSGDELNCSMYLFNVGDTSAPKNLKQAEEIASLLANAQKKGAEINLLLENSNQAFGAHIVEANKRAEALLINKGINHIKWDNPSQISHMKFCVISHPNHEFDILLGSSNWNYLDLELNHQLNWLISKDQGTIALPLLQYFNSALKY